MSLMIEDRELLRQFVRDAARAALDELIRRHLGVVYSSALRQTGDRHLAEDVTQAVFLVLAEKGRTIRTPEAVGGWLLSVTHCAAVNAMKKRANERKHERLAARPEMIQAAADQWSQVGPLLDAELNRLAGKDRDAVVLRFFHDRSFVEIGAELGLSEEAARKRVVRALKRLRELLARRGVSVQEGALMTAIAANAAQPVPGHLLGSTIAATAHGAAATQTVSIAKGAMNMMAWAKAKMVGAITAAILLAALGGIFVAKSIAQMQMQVPANGTVMLTGPNVPNSAPAAEAPPDDAVYHFVLGSQDMLDLDTPLVTSIRVQWPNGMKPAELNAWIAPLNKAEQQWRSAAGIDIGILNFTTVITAPGVEASKTGPGGFSSWNIVSYGKAVVTPLTSEQWDNPDAVAIQSTIEDWDKEHPLVIPGDGAEEKSITLATTGLPFVYGCRTVAGGISLFRITDLRAGGGRTDSRATIEVKKILPAPTTQPANPG
jgi:RNA polymerase sigma factor (sigma-70 family)